MTRKTMKPGSMSRRRLLATAGAGTAIAASPFCINLLRAEEANIKIGFPVPLTGPYGTEAQDQVRAGQLAVAQFNDAGGRISALFVFTQPGSKADVTLFHCDVRFVHPIYD